MINLIAEIGSNHAGDISLAKEMICAAAENGADYAKFQSWREEDIPPGPWDDKEKFFHFDNKRAFYKQAQLSNEEHYELISTCEKVGIKFLTTCFNFDRINFLSQLNIDTIKVASCDSTNQKMIKNLNEKFKRVIVSTGMTNNKEIDQITELVDPSRLVLMHCVSIYPTPLEKISLPRLNDIRKKTKAKGCSFGISDHSIGINFSLTAVTQGATWVERHFTIDKRLTGPDNKMSVLPEELKTIKSFSEDFDKLNACDRADCWEQEIEFRKIASRRFKDSE